MSYVLLGIPLFIVLWAAITYNTLIRLQNHMREAWADIDTELKRRHELIPNIVATVKGYAAHERDVLEQVTQARTRAAAAAPDPASRAADEGLLVAALKRLFMVVERYPTLQASQNFLGLERELANTEDRIAAARRFYNANVRDLNNRRESFPSNLVAKVFKFAPGEFFQIEDSTVRLPPDVRFADQRGSG